MSGDENGEPVATAKDDGDDYGNREDVVVAANFEVGGLEPRSRFSGQSPSTGRSRKSLTRSSVLPHGRETWLLMMPSMRSTVFLVALHHPGTDRLGGGLKLACQIIGITPGTDQNDYFTADIREMGTDDYRENDTTRKNRSRFPPIRVKPKVVKELHPCHPVNRSTLSYSNHFV